MKIGDLVVLRNCEQQGKTGIIIADPGPARFGPGTELYYVFSEAVMSCFTGNQLELA